MADEQNSNEQWRRANKEALLSHQGTAEAASTPAASPGPPHPPKTPLEYQLTRPNVSERLLAMMESRLANEQDMDRFALQRDSRRADLGLYLGVSLAVLCLAASVALSLYGCPAAYSAFGMPGMAVVVGAIIHGTRRPSQGGRQKAGLLTRARAWLGLFSDIKGGCLDDTD